MEQSRTYKGIVYVRLKSLSPEERDQIKNWLNADTLIKIQTDKELMSDCILYKDYEYWHTHVFTKISLIEEEKSDHKVKAIKKKLLGWSLDQG